jgi:hypothetical protein
MEQSLSQRIAAAEMLSCNAGVSFPIVSDADAVSGWNEVILAR